MRFLLYCRTLQKTKCYRPLQIFGISHGHLSVKPFLLPPNCQSFSCLRPKFYHKNQRLLIQPPITYNNSLSHLRHFSKGDSYNSPISWRTVFITAAIGGVFTMAMFYFKQAKELRLAKERSRQLGKAALGGPWSLIDHNNQPKSNKDFFGQWVLIYFGFTHCPDICPDEIEKMVQAVDMMEKNPNVPNVQPLFITVDPERDTVDAIKLYVNEFSPKLLGLTGDKERIHQATRAYRVYYSSGPKDEDNDYIVDHTIIMYLINPKGDFVDYFGQNRTAEDIYNSITLHMKKYEFNN
ncbi:Hypothetical predicted protein [Octopus vulgaris]|uniref:Protein SCO1 homolog, mitochondrial n=1 Tax=Octopus vulgaris TaxID=6645 RepID=A0AA36BBE3_OCTVU|nr:Hypothetical predicted protein [Octopus vulgaris]